MKVDSYTKSESVGATRQQEVVEPAPRDGKTTQAFAELERGVRAALETYSNVHRGSGHNSLATTRLYEQARDIVLETLGLDKARTVVIFCTPRRAALLMARLKPASVRCLSSEEIGLPLGVRALAVRRGALPRVTPLGTGGGTARLVSPGWVIWAKAPDKFEAGTPAIVNVITFAKALRVIRQLEKNAFQEPAEAKRAGVEKLAAAAAQTAAAQLPASAADLTAEHMLYHDDLEQYSGRALLEALRQTLIGRGVRVPTVAGARPFINLDNGASTPTFEPVWEVVCKAWRQPRQVQQDIIEEVKSICAGVLGASLEDYEVIFTSNTTEAINLAAESLRNETARGKPAVVVNTFLEHNSNELPWRRVRGAALVRLGVDEEGFVDLQALEALLRETNQLGQHRKKRIQLVAVSGASNVLGVCNDLAEISRVVHRYGARLLVDAAQMVAHRKVEMERWGIDYLAFSAHKVYAPFGAGVLLARKGLLRFRPAEREQIQSSGEENVAGIAALGKALVLLQRIGLDVVQAEEQALTGQALRGMAQIPGLRMYGIQDPESPRFAQKGGVIAFSIKGSMAPRVAKALAERGGIGIRSGCHCAHLLVKRLLHISPPLQLLQGLMLPLFPQIALPGVARVSLGIENGEADVDTLIHVLENIAQQPPPGMGNPFSARKAPRSAIEQQMDDFAQAAARRVYG